MVEVSLWLSDSVVKSEFMIPIRDTAGGATFPIKVQPRAAGKMPTLQIRLSGATLSFSERLHEIRTGFERPFWIANISEIFERLSYYGAFASLALYLQERLNFSTEQTGTLTGIFGGMV